MTKKIIVGLTIIILVGLFGIKALFHPGFYTSHDGEHQVIRLYHFNQAIKDGQFPPRWAGTADNGYGYPLFIFSYQSPWMVGVPLLGLGFSLTDAVKVVFILGFIVSGLVMFLWLNETFGFLPGLIGAILYLWAPYRFSNIFVRASLGEATAFIFIPLLFWGISRCKDEDKWRTGIVFTSLGLAGIILSHLMVLIIFFVPLILWILIQIKDLVAKTKTVKRIIIGILLGIGLSAYYILPAILERYYTIAPEVLRSYYSDYFVSLGQLIYSKWGYGFDFPGTINDAMSFQVGIAQWLIIGLLAILVVRGWTKKRKIDPLLLFAFFSFIFSVIMMLPISRPIWELVTKYSYFDFPWRFLSLSVFIASLAAALLLSRLKKFRWFVAIFIIFVALYTNRNHLRVNQYVYNNDSFYKNNLQTTNMFDEYRSKTIDSNYLKQQRNRVEFDGKEVSVTAQIPRSNYYLVEGKAQKVATVKINIAYFPGWRVWVNGNEQLEIKGGEGVMEVKVPEGDFNIEAKFTNTPIRTIANLLSIFAFLTLFFIGVKDRAIKLIFASFFIWRILLIIITALSLKILPFRLDFLGGEELYFRDPLLWGWANMDGVHYLSIAQSGYHQFEQAFFPLYPLLIRGLGKIIGGNYLLAGLFISNLSFLASLVVFYKLVKIKYSTSVAKWAVLALLIFPTSFFFGSVYTESLFLFLALTSIYSALNKKWILAGVLAGFASVTRLVGIFLLPALFYEWGKEKKKSILQFLGIASGSFGLLSYMYYLWKNYGDPLLFFHVQPSFGAGRSGREIILIPQVIYRYLKIFMTASFSYEYLIALLEFLVFIFAIYLLLKNFKTIPVSYQIFAWLTIITPTLTGSLSSMPRYLLIVFPIFIALATENRIIKMFYLLLSLVLLTLGLMFFFHGYFVS